MLKPIKNSETSGLPKPSRSPPTTADKGQNLLSKKLPVTPILLFIIPNIKLVYKKSVLNMRLLNLYPRNLFWIFSC